MKIVQLSASNIKRISAVEIAPSGNTVIIAGDNGAGKSSVLEAIVLGLGGPTAAKEITRPVREGATGAEVIIDLGDLLVTRRWKANGTTDLIVENKDGARFRSPQAMLDELVGRLSFDPMAFVAERPKDQIATLVSIVNLPFDPDEMAHKRAELFEERTGVNRKAKELAAQLAGEPPVDASTPTELVGVSDLVAELEHVDSLLVVRENLDREVHRTTHNRAAAEEAVAAARAALDAAEARLNTAMDEGTEAQMAAAQGTPLVELEDTRHGIVERLATVDATNAQIRAKIRRVDLDGQLTGYERRAQDLTLEIEGLDSTKADALANADLPVSGLSFDESGVTFNGLPLAQASTAEQIRVSMALAVAANPKIRICRIKDGGLLDERSLALVAEMAEKHDCQVWIEVIRSDDPMAVIIEDGAVAS